MVDLHHIKVRVKVLAKALGDLIVHHHQTLSCQSLDVHVPVAWPKEYEFSCSSTPAAGHAASWSVSRSRRRHYPCSFYYYDNHHRSLRRNSRSVNLANVVFYDPPRLKNYVDARNVRDGYDMGVCVDKAADEFIERFYKQLKLQN